MSPRGNSKVVPFLVLVIIVLLALLVWNYLENRPVETLVRGDDTNTAAPTSTKPAITPTDPATSGWKTYQSPDGKITLKYPGYISIGPDSKTGKTNIGPTVMTFHDLKLNPNPNTDFTIFTSYLEFSHAKNFILDLGQRFVSYDADANVWYSNKDDADKPTAESPIYKNIFKSENAYKPSEYVKTLTGMPSYGPFLLGDESRGSRIYLVPILSKGIIVTLGIKYNNEALANSTITIKALKAKFDRDISHIIKSVSVAE